MQANRGALAVAMAAVLALAACGGDKTPNLMNLRSATNGPDEFGILPPKALELPEDLTALPEPTLGGTNRTDPTPIDDAIVALGGKPRAAGGVPAADSALVRYGSRYGTTAGIRETLAAEDLEYRRKNDGRLLERIFNVNVYFKAYRKQSLDQQAELRRWRKAGLRTPSAPPANPGEE
jgi:Protein of unknown function (DUF3035)